MVVKDGITLKNDSNLAKLKLTKAMEGLQPTRTGAGDAGDDALGDEALGGEALGDEALGGEALGDCDVEIPSGASGEAPSGQQQPLPEREQQLGKDTMWRRAFLLVDETGEVQMPLRYALDLPAGAVVWVPPKVMQCSSKAAGPALLQAAPLQSSASAPAFPPAGLVLASEPTDNKPKKQSTRQKQLELLEKSLGVNWDKSVKQVRLKEQAFSVDLPMAKNDDDSGTGGKVLRADWPEDQIPSGNLELAHFVNYLVDKKLNKKHQVADHRRGMNRFHKHVRRFLGLWQPSFGVSQTTKAIAIIAEGAIMCYCKTCHINRRGAIMVRNLKHAF